MRLKSLLRGAASAMVLAGVSIGGAAFAQDENETTVFEELIVTAQKRPQRLQDVPITVTVATEQLLEDAGVNDIRDMAILTPGLTVTSTASEAAVTARIRGVGTVGDNPGMESSVGVVIDGVYRPRNGVGFGDLGDVARIEVLKGPQGTLFGKNTSAGVINVITVEPSFNPGAEFELTGGTYGAFGGSFNLTGPLVPDKIAGSLFAASRERDGFMDVETLGSGAPRWANDQNYHTVRAQLLALPNDTFSARVIADYTDRDESCCAAATLFVGATPTGNRGFIVNNTAPGSIDLTPNAFERLAYANRPFAQRIEDMGLSAEVNYDFSDDIALTSISAIRRNRAELGSDSDATAADLIWIPTDGSNYTQFDQISQELRATGVYGPVNWLVGLFAAKEEIENRSPLNYGSDFYAYMDQRLLGNFPAAFGRTAGTQHALGNARNDAHDQEGTTFAVFTNNDWTIAEGLTATLGLRYTSEEKELRSRYRTTSDSCSFTETSPLAANPAALKALCVPIMNTDFDALGGGTNVQNIDEDEFSGTVKLAWRYNEQIMTFASASRGYKAGGFNLDRESPLCAPDGTPVVTTFPAQPMGGPVVPLSPFPTHSGCPTRAGPGGTQVLDTGRAGFSWAADPDTSFRPEIVESFELGVKTQWFDNSLLVNVTGFTQEFTDFQLNTFAGTQFVVVTIPVIESKGIDADFLWNTPVKGLSIQGGATVTDTIIGRFTPEDFDNFADFDPVAHMQNRRLSFAPKYTTSLAVTHETDINERLSLRWNIAGKYNSSYNTGSDLNAAKQQPSFTVVNARIGVGAPDDAWRLELWGANIFDKDYIQVGFNGPFQVTTNAPQFIGQDPGVVNNPTSVYPAFLGAPKTFGLTLRIKR